MKNFDGRWVADPVTGCWDWTGPLGRGGYGQFWDGTRPRKSHRYALELATGVKPDRWTLACHHCDNRTCVNPAHLYWGTPAQNTADMMARGRWAGGRPPQPFRKDWKDIWEARQAGASYQALAKGRGVSPAAIWKLIKKIEKSRDAGDH